MGMEIEFVTLNLSLYGWKWNCV